MLAVEILVELNHPDAHPGPNRRRGASSSRAMGTLSKWHPNYEFRPDRWKMAEAVEAALADKRHLIVEAGTGTGKTLAYLVPGAALRGKRIVGLDRHQDTFRSSFSSRTFRSSSSTSRGR